MGATAPDRPPYGRPVQVLFGLIAALLALFLGHGLWKGDIAYGLCAGRMSRHCDALHLTAPLDLLLGTVHLGSLLFALLGLACAPRFILRKPVLLATAAVFIATTVLINVLAALRLGVG